VASGSARESYRSLARHRAVRSAVNQGRYHRAITLIRVTRPTIEWPLRVCVLRCSNSVSIAPAGTHSTQMSSTGWTRDFLCITLLPCCVLGQVVAPTSLARGDHLYHLPDMPSIRYGPIECWTKTDLCLSRLKRPQLVTLFVIRPARFAFWVVTSEPVRTSR
jgi:hypothetical protein